MAGPDQVLEKQKLRDKDGDEGVNDFTILTRLFYRSEKIFS